MQKGLFFLTDGNLSYQEAEVRAHCCAKCERTWVSVLALSTGGLTVLPERADGVVYRPALSCSHKHYALYSKVISPDRFFLPTQPAPDPRNLGNLWTLFSEYDPESIDEWYKHQRRTWEYLYGSPRAYGVYLGEVISSTPRVAEHAPEYRALIEYSAEEPCFHDRVLLTQSEGHDGDETMKQMWLRQTSGIGFEQECFECFGRRVVETGVIVNDFFGYCESTRSAARLSIEHAGVKVLKLPYECKAYRADGCYETLTISSPQTDTDMISAFARGRVITIWSECSSEPCQIQIEVGRSGRKIDLEIRSVDILFGPDLVHYHPKGAEAKGSEGQSRASDDFDPFLEAEDLP
jgi:hypothetical protein